MIKFLAILLLLAVVCRWAFGRWPWSYITAENQRARSVRRARALLGVNARAGEPEIREAHRRLAATLHPDRGGSDARLAEINAARDLLLETTSPKKVDHDHEP